MGTVGYMSPEQAQGMETGPLLGRLCHRRHPLRDADRSARLHRCLADGNHECDPARSTADAGPPADDDRTDCEALSREGPRSSATPRHTRSPAPSPLRSTALAPHPTRHGHGPGRSAIDQGHPSRSCPLPTGAAILNRSSSRTASPRTSSPSFHGSARCSSSLLTRRSPTRARQ